MSVCVDVREGSYRWVPVTATAAKQKLQLDRFSLLYQFAVMTHAHNSIQHEEWKMSDKSIAKLKHYTILNQIEPHWNC